MFTNWQTLWASRSFQGRGSLFVHTFWEVALPVIHRRKMILDLGGQLPAIHKSQKPPTLNAV